MEDKDSADVADCWEDADAEELEKRMELRQRETGVTACSAGQHTLSDNLRSSPTQQPPLRMPEWEGTQYVPQVKILKRTTDSGEAASSGKSSAEAGHKSMAQREAEYATTRARILGNQSKDSSSRD